MCPRKHQSPPTERSRLKNVALFVEEEQGTGSHTIALSQIERAKNQPRRYFSSETLASLKESIQKQGILQPLLVRPVGKKYELIAGERRYRAATEIGLTEVPVIIREMSDEQASLYALTENLQREDLNPVEETEAILALLALKLNSETQEVISLLNQLANTKRGLTDNVVRSEEQQAIEEVFTATGRLSAESFRTHRLPLLRLPSEILEALRQGKIEYTKAKAIAKVKDSQLRQKLLSEAIRQSLSLNQIREQIKESQPKPEKKDLLSRFDVTYKQVKKSKKLLDNNPKKRKKIESLLMQIEKLITEEKNQ